MPWPRPPPQPPCWPSGRRAPAVGLLAGALVGLATAIKAPYALFGAGLAWAARRSPRALAALALGAAAILIPSYLLAGPARVSATFGPAATTVIGATPWAVIAKVLIKVFHWHDPYASINILGLIGCAVLAIVLVRRMSPGPLEFPAVRVALALGLAFLFASPQEVPWYAALIFPLLAVFPASGLDWIALAFATASAAGAVPFLFFTGLHPAWLARILRISEWGIVPLSITAVGLALLWLCYTNDWRSVLPVSSTSGLHRRQALDAVESAISYPHRSAVKRSFTSAIFAKSHYQLEINNMRKKG